jgi:hypothetical protein
LLDGGLDGLRGEPAEVATENELPELEPIFVSLGFVSTPAELASAAMIAAFRRSMNSPTFGIRKAATRLLGRSARVSRLVASRRRRGRAPGMLRFDGSHHSTFFTLELKVALRVTFSFFAGSPSSI